MSVFLFLLGHLSYRGQIRPRHQHGKLSRPGDLVEKRMCVPYRSVIGLRFEFRPRHDPLCLSGLLSKSVSVSRLDHPHR